MTSDKRLVSERFPRASQYHPEWVLASVSGGANSLWVTEWLTTALDLKVNPEWLEGRMLLYWTGQSHHTPGLVGCPRDYDGIVEAGRVARRAVERGDLALLAEAMWRSCVVQLDEGMDPLPPMGELAAKYLGEGHGGYALYLFGAAEVRAAAAAGKSTRIVEPYLKHSAAR